MAIGSGCVRCKYLILEINELARQDRGRIRRDKINLKTLIFNFKKFQQLKHHQNIRNVGVFQTSFGSFRSPAVA